MEVRDCPTLPFSFSMHPYRPTTPRRRPPHYPHVQRHESSCNVTSTKSLRARVQRLNELARGLLLDQRRFDRQDSGLRPAEREAYQKALSDATAALHRAKETLLAALRRIERERAKG
jgi:hypothetical protein